MARVIRKLWYVKREVVASTLQEALRTSGKVYEVQLADEKSWPENKNNLGFVNDKEETKK